MKLAAAQALVELAQDGEIVPNVLDRRVHEAVARAVEEAAVRSGVARAEAEDVGVSARRRVST